MKIDQTKTRPSSEGLKTRPQFVHRTSAFNEQHREEVVYISVAKLKPFRSQGRKYFDEEELQNLAETIREHGIRQPLTVLRVEGEEEVSFEVVSGERRLKAATIVGLTSVPCIVLQNLEKAEEIALVENIQRQDLHPIELARSLKNLVEARGWGGQTALTKKLGLSASKISELIKLMEFSGDVQELILSSNLRGREDLRKIFTFKTDEERKNFILSQSSSESKSEKKKTEKLFAERSQSVLRVSVDHGEFKVQKSKIQNLTREQKEKFLILLTEICQELKLDSLE